MSNTTETYTAFESDKLAAQGSLSDVVIKVKQRFTKNAALDILIFSDSTGKVIDFNFQGTDKDVMKRLEVFTTEQDATETSGPGRPKLGVISREVSLLPRHWEWLATQSGGASSTLRKLVEESMKKTATTVNLKQAQERTYKFMSVLAGNFPGYEEALRALYKKDEKKFLVETEKWPKDVRHHTLVLAKSVFKNN